MPDQPTLSNFDMPEPETPAAPPSAMSAPKNRNADWEPPNLGKAKRLPVPNFDDPNRKPTCLEVDFPIAPINALSQLEGNAGKPIYQMSKWWARRRSSVFRSMLIAAGAEAPDNHEEAAKLVWDHYYANHQKAGSFRKLRVLDIFMGGGVTLVEGSRLGMQMTGVDLNPVAWFVCKNELACSDPEQVKALFDHIEAEVKPLIQPFYTTTCPRGHKGKWIDVETGQTVDVDPIDLPPEERKRYRWEGPEIIYTFWAKHVPCKGIGCDHRTPIFRSPVIAEKTLSTSYIALTCPSCAHQFQAEFGETRMAPGCERIVLDSEPSFTELSQPFAQMLNDYNKGNSNEKRERIMAVIETVQSEPGLRCPDCNSYAGNTVQRVLERHARTKKTGDIQKKHFEVRKTKVAMKLLVHPDWLKGARGTDADGGELGGYPDAAPALTEDWHRVRLEKLLLIEVRGTDLPDKIVLGDQTTVCTTEGVVPQSGHAICGKCGLQQPVVDSFGQAGHGGPLAVYALQCHCPVCESEGYTYGGRFFKVVDVEDMARLSASEWEWDSRSRADLNDSWPREEIFFGHMTHQRQPLPQHGYTRWHHMFSPRQLLVQASFLNVITTAVEKGWPLDLCEQTLGALQQYLRMMCMFSFWHRTYDKLAPALSNANFHPKTQPIETNVFGALGYGRWPSCRATVEDALSWVRSPWELAVPEQEGTTKSVKVEVGDGLTAGGTVLVGSSTSLAQVASESVDFVATDPPFGDNLYYADLADFFYVWLRIPLLRWYEGLPERQYFVAERTPHSVEAIDNPAEHPDDREDYEKERFITDRVLNTVRELAGDDALEVNAENPLYRPVPSSDFYCQTLTACWAETHRVLKPG